MQTASSLLLIGIIVGLFGWINQDYIRKWWNWYTTMRPYMLANFRPYVLTKPAEQNLKPKALFRECAKDCPKMIVIPPGEFMMGSPDDELSRRCFTLPTRGEEQVDFVGQPTTIIGQPTKICLGRAKNEGPQHRVTIARAFAVSMFDVTFADWDACVAVGGCSGVPDTGLGRGSKPVINVSWKDAKQYVAWLSRMTGKPYRLLTEAEWEYAARGVTSAGEPHHLYPWGDEIGLGNANCNGCGSQWDNKSTSPVGSFKPNAFGLYDMAGNVWQWVEDCYQDSLAGLPDDGSPHTTADCNSRVTRGGSWDNFPPFLRSAHRDEDPVDGRFGKVGFRVARTLTP